MDPRQRKRLARILAVVGGSVFATLLGLACLRYSFADALERLSYDLPFLWRSTLHTSEVTIVYLDEFSAKQLGQPLDAVWNRKIHAALLDRLTEDKARLVLYDIVFDAPAPDPEEDLLFARAIEANGTVVLGAAFDITQSGGQVQQERISPPIKPFRRAAAGWGVLAFRPIDPDYGVRAIFFGTSLIPTATWKAAEILGAPVAHTPRDKMNGAWINYYGPRDTISSVGIAQVLEPGALPPGYFTNKIVLIGGRSSVGFLGTSRDEFSTPFARISRRFSPGTEVHATILLNLLHSEWLSRLAPKYEFILVIAFGLAVGALGLLRPSLAAIMAALLLGGVIALACLLQWNTRLWFAWLIPAGVQLPVGFIWAVGSQYLLEARRQKELRRAFGFYLSPEMANRIADSDFDLTPGGKLVDATVIFTDLENFTTLSEDLDPRETSSVLIEYFRQTTRCILEKQGTIIKYVGDAVMAGWGAPVDDAEHARHATEAACDLRCLTEMEVRGIKLRTRIGVHTGRVLAGNLGSEYRFDYTMIGDAVNFASRLESLNKYLGTQALISDAVRVQLEDRFITRRLGEFTVAGKTHSVIIHELLCRCEDADGEQTWIENFEQALRLFQKGDLRAAAELMQKTRTLRGGNDGPAQFYLRKLDGLDEAALPPDWRGVVSLTEK